MDPKNLPDTSLFKDRGDVQLRFNDVDVLGHVNNTVYFTLYDTGKAHYFSNVNGKSMDWKHVDTVIANVDCCFVEPIFYGEEIEVLTKCTAIHDKSLKLLQVIREKKKDRIKSACETVMVSFDPVEGVVKEVPEELRRRIESFEGTPLSETDSHKRLEK